MKTKWMSVAEYETKHGKLSSDPAVCEVCGEEGSCPWVSENGCLSLCDECHTTNAAAATLGRSRTPKKAAASRENGKRGGRPTLPVCRQCGIKVKAKWWRAMNKAGFAPRHLSCPSCGCEGVEAWPR